MAYDPVVAVPRLLLAMAGGNAGSVWVYQSSDAHGTVSGANYFSDGRERGLKVGDVMFVIGPSGATTIHSVTAVTASVSPGTAPYLWGKGSATISAAVLS